MAYPNPIKTVGALSSSNDIFEYFKGATQALLNNEVQGEYNKIPWTLDFRLIFGGNNYPITRYQFEIIIWANFNDPEDLISASGPVSGWSIDKVNDWAKVKCIMMALFGSVTGAPEDTSFSYLTGSQQDVSGWRVHDMTYLRLALVKFNNYGTCHPETAYLPPPTSPVTNTTTRTFNWTNATGYTSLSNYEYSMNGSVFAPVPAKPITIPADIHVEAGDLVVRTTIGPNHYINHSDVISNNAVYIAPVFINVWVEVLSNSYIVYARLSDEYSDPLASAVTISGNVQVQRTVGGSITRPYSVTIPITQDYGSENYSFGENYTSLSVNNQILTGSSVPASIGTRPITLRLNIQ